MGFNDLSVVGRQGHAVIPAGGVIFEAGCYSAASDETVYIPTKMTTCIALCGGSEGCVAAPCVSLGHIKGTTAVDKTDKFFNYIAIGW